MKKDMRRCGQCRAVSHRLSLVQIRHNGSGFTFAANHIDGRSLYLCQKKDCWQKASKNKNILRGNLKPHMLQWQPFCGQVIEEMQ